MNAAASKTGTLRRGQGRCGEFSDDTIGYGDDLGEGGPGNISRDAATTSATTGPDMAASSARCSSESVGAS